MPRSGIIGQDGYVEGENYADVDESLYTPLGFGGCRILKPYKDDSFTNEFFYEFLKSER